jgi:hypothetical protein
MVLLPSYASPILANRLLYCLKHRVPVGNLRRPILAHTCSCKNPDFVPIMVTNWLQNSTMKMPIPSHKTFTRSHKTNSIEASSDDKHKEIVFEIVACCWGLSSSFVFLCVLLHFIANKTTSAETMMLQDAAAAIAAGVTPVQRKRKSPHKLHTFVQRYEWSGGWGSHVCTRLRRSDGFKRRQQCS